MIVRKGPTPNLLKMAEVMTKPKKNNSDSAVFSSYSKLVVGSGLRYGDYRWRFGFALALVDKANTTSLTPLAR